MNTLMNLVYLAIAIVIVSGVRFNTAQADAVSLTPIFLFFHTHTPRPPRHANLTRITRPLPRPGRRTPRPSRARSGRSLFPTLPSSPDDNPFRAERRPQLRRAVGTTTLPPLLGSKEDVTLDMTTSRRSTTGGSRRSPSGACNSLTSVPEKTVRPGKVPMIGRILLTERSSIAIFSRRTVHM